MLTMKGIIRHNRANFYIDLWWEGERFRLYSDRGGEPLDSERRADRLLSHIRYEIDHGTFSPSDYSKQPRTALRFENFTAAWLQRQEQRAKQRLLANEYIRSSKSYLNNYLIPFFSGKSVKDIYEGMLEDFMLQLPDHLSTKTRHNIMAILHKMLSDALNRREIGRVPRFPKLELTEPEIKWLQPEEQNALLAEVDCPIMRALFQFLMWTGCRHGEARALRWEKLNFQEGYAVISAGMDGEVYRESTKEKNVRLLPLSDRVIDTIRGLPRSLSGFVFTVSGSPFTMKQVWRAWSRAGKKAGVSVKPYQGTRHSLASQLVNNGESLGVVQEILGHKTADMVRRYAKFKMGTLRDALNRRVENG